MHPQVHIFDEQHTNFGIIFCLTDNILQNLWIAALRSLEIPLARSSRPLAVVPQITSYWTQPQEEQHQEMENIIHTVPQPKPVYSTSLKCAFF